MSSITVKVLKVQRVTVDSDYAGSATNPQLEDLTRRAYTKRRSRLVDHWLQYADSEGLTGQGGAA